MLFNSLEFPVFFVGIVALYFALPGRWRWALLLAGSYVFYGAWRIEYLGLIWLSTLIDYVVGLRMGALPDRAARRPWLILSLVANLGLLGLFKYADFVGSWVQALLDLTDSGGRVPVLDLLLPVGISFYTFQTLSYSVDVYRGQRAAEAHLGRFALYVSYFPQLVAGPIERSTRLLPQLEKVHAFDAVRVRDGLALMLFGFFKKCVVADRVGLYADRVFASPGTEYEGFACLLGTYFFQWQLYCDFSGYSDIAIGAAGVMGVRLMTNFRRPFLATSILDFWNRWHISLTTWFRDYVYLPLLGPGAGGRRRLLSVLLVFALSGLWHGPTWNCVLWGLVNGLMLVAGVASVQLQNRWASRSGLGRWPRLRRLVAVVVTFHLGTLGLMIFRTASLGDYLAHMRSLVAPREAFWQVGRALSDYEMGLAYLFIGVLLAIQLLQERHDDTLVEALGRRPRWIRWPVYYAFLFAVLCFGEFSLQPFYYFQF